LASSWLQRKLPPRDYLLEGVLSTTSRYWIFGKTGIGKTLFTLELGYAIAAGRDFLNWRCVRRARVMYLDGEMPAETMKERIEAAAAIYGIDVEFYAYNRDVLGQDEMLPLNTPAGQNWLWQEVEKIRPDLIIFDSIMCLLTGNLRDEETFKPCLPLVQQLSGRRIGQIWANHTGKNAEQSYGDSGKEWHFDSMIRLGQEQENGPIMLEFTKKRLCTPKNFGLYQPQVITRKETGWTGERGAKAGKEVSSQVQKIIWLRDVYWELADGVPIAAGYDGQPVRKVSVDAARERMVQRGFLTVEDGKIPDSERKLFQRARERRIAQHEFAGEGGWFWSIRDRVTWGA
jgi:RecA-family ATPase